MPTSNKDAQVPIYRVTYLDSRTRLNSTVLFMTPKEASRFADRYGVKAIKCSVPKGEFNRLRGARRIR